MIMAEGGPHHDTPSSPTVCLSNTAVGVLLTSSPPHSGPSVWPGKGKPGFVTEDSGPLSSCPPPVNGSPLQAATTVLLGQYRTNIGASRADAHPVWGW